MADSLENGILGNILIVEDRLDNLWVLTDILTQKGYKVQKANNAETALLAAELTSPDLIILDSQMLDLDVNQLCTLLKNDPTTSDIPLIFISGLDELFDKFQSFQLGGIDYIFEPFNPDEVCARVQIHLTMQKQKQLLQHEILKRQEKENQLIQEINKRKEIEEVLYQSRALLSSILNSSLDGIAAMQAVRDSSGIIVNFRCVLINSILAQKLGRNRKNLIGSLFLKKLLNKINPSLFDDFVELVETGTPLVKDFLYLYNNCKKAWYHFIAVKLGDGFAITIRDITERKKIELALQSANHKLKRLANLDGLTQIPNRRYFDKTYQQQWQQCAKEKQFLSLIVCDIDCFKSYNDYYGHLAGDSCIRQVAVAINSIVEDSRYNLARYGGEEFVVILPNTSLKKAWQLAQKIREAVKQLNIPHEKSTVGKYVTLSLGVATVVPSLDMVPQVLIANADKALYSAKQQGRDRALIFAEDLQTQN